MELTVTLRTERSEPVDPYTVATLCEGISALASSQQILVEEQQVQVAAKVDRLANGSLILGFLVTAALSSAPAKAAMASIATGLATTAIWEAFKHVYDQSDGAKQRKAEEFASMFKRPEVVDTLKDVFGALQRDAAVTGLKVEADERLKLEPVEFNEQRIEVGNEKLAEIEPETLRGEQILWRKHVRILEIAGEPPVARWKIWWDQHGGACEAWISAPRIPSGQKWTPDKDKTLVVDVKIRFREGKGTYRLQSAEILTILWAEMDR